MPCEDIVAKAKQTRPFKKSYSDLKKLKTYEERLNYLYLGGSVGKETFGFDRYANQALYKSKEWRSLREKIIIRDKGLDLGAEDAEEISRPTIHHINPITMDDIVNRSPCVMDPNNLISCSDRTHKWIHYGDKSDKRFIERNTIVERTKGDTCPWKKGERHV